MSILVPIAAAVFAASTVILWRERRKAARVNFIRAFQYPPGLYDKLRKKRPEFSLKDCQLVGNALRQFFMAHLQSGCKFVSMPSQATDDLWHEFILYTKNYDAFCRKAFGRFLHHSPAVVLSADQTDNTGLRRCWWFACLEEHINPRRALRLPLLFAIDAKLGIADGFRYAPNCSELQKDGSGDVYCGADLNPVGAAGCGGGSAWDSSSPNFSDSGGDSGGSSASDAGGGSSCGGGCGGGGCGGGGD